MFNGLMIARGGWQMEENNAHRLTRDWVLQIPDKVTKPLNVVVVVDNKNIIGLQSSHHNQLLDTKREQG
jgi:hypothetical protein